MAEDDNLSQRFFDADQEPELILTPISGYEVYPTVSLKDAVQPINSSLHNCDTMIEIALRNSINPADGLTQDESASIHLYTMQWPRPHPSLFTLLNEKLRSQDRDGLIPWFSFLKLFLTALYKLPSYRGTIWRGVKGNLSDQYKDDHFWWGFSSCTETMHRIEKFMGNDTTRTAFTIECSYGKSILSHSYFKNENEILLLPGTYFQVVDKMKATNDLFIIHLREKIPPFETIVSPLLQTESTTNQMISTDNIASNNLSDQTDLELHIVSSISEDIETNSNNHLNQTNSIANSNQNKTIPLKTNNLSNTSRKFIAFQHLFRREKVKSRKTKFKQNAQTVAGGNEQGNKLNQFNEPYGIFVDKHKSIYIADCGNHRIVQWKYNAEEGQIVAGGNGKGNRIDQLEKPTDVIVDQSSHSIIIADRGNKRVIRWFNQNQQEILIQSISCLGLSMDKFGFMYVSDCEKNEVRRWKIGEKDVEGTLLAGGNGEGDKLNQLSFPTYIFVDDEQSVYISDYSNHRVMKWKKYAKEGIIVAGGNSEGNNLNNLYDPRGLFVDQWGQIYVSDCVNDRIMRWIEGKNVGEIVVGRNRKGNESNQFCRPTGLSFDLEGNFYVADEGNNRIQKFEIIS